MREICEYVRTVAREFKPQRIILFGSHGYGTPTEDSDVDLMVVMPHQGDDLEQAIEIRSRVGASFPLDLLVRSGHELRERYRLEDWFIREIVDNGKVLYEASHH